AQYYHVLRRQAARLRPGGGWSPQPLVVMSPKSLLRHPRAASRLEELAYGSFQPVIDEGPPENGEPRRSSGVSSEGPLAPPASLVPGPIREAVTRLVLCSGKIAVDLLESDARAAAPSVAVAKVEELYLFPRYELEQVMTRYPGLRELVWVQEEPENMG